MENTVDLALPCRLVTLTVLVGPEKGMTTLENLVSRAIPAGRNTVESLARLFALPKRVILDVVHSLWSKGHIIVGFETGIIELADGTRDLLPKGSLPHESATQERRRFLFEPVTGTIFPEHLQVRRPAENVLKVPHLSEVSEADLSAEQLLAAVQAAIRHDKRRGFRSNVLDVSFGSPVLRAPEELAWYQVRAVLHLDETTDRLNITLLDEGRLWSLRARTTLSGYLANLADNEPRHPFVNEIRGRARRRLAPPESLVSLMNQAEKTVAGLDKTEPGLVTRRHEKLIDLVFGVYERLGEAISDRADVQTVENLAGHEWVLEDLITSAETQLVLVSPHITYSWLNQVFPRLDAAMEKGVTIVLIWGRSAADTLEERVRNALNQLKRRHGSRFLLPDRSARTAACAVVQDDRRVLIGSHSPLAMERNPNRPMSSVLIEARSNGPATAQVIEDLLLWCRKTYPYYQQSLNIQLPKDFDTPARRASGSLPVPELPGPPTETDDPATIGLWARTWHSHISNLLESVRATLDAAPIVRLVKDGVHRDLMARAIKESEERLVILDDRFDARTTNAIVAQHLQNRSDKGVQVYLTYPKVKGGDGDNALADLIRKEKAHVRHQKAAARAIVWDEHLLIGSHAPLSDNPRLGRTQNTQQLGVHIRDAAFTDAFLRSVSLRLPLKSAAPAPRRRTDAVADHATEVAYPLLTEALQAEGSGGFSRTLRRRFSEYQTPWKILDVWKRAGVHDHALRRGAALLLSEHDGVPEEVRDLWGRWLIAEAWKRRAFVEAAIIARLLPAPERRSEPAVCLASSVLETGPLESSLENAVFTLIDCAPSPAALQVGGMAGIAESLLWGGASGRYVVELLERELSPAWLEMARATARFSIEVPGTPLPFTLFRAELTQSVEQAATEKAWNRIAKDIDHINRLQHRFDFGSGAAMHKGLFTPEGILTRIQQAAHDPSLRPYIHDDLPENTHKHLDRIVQQAGFEPISWGRQKYFLKRVDLIVRETADLSLRANPDQARTLAGPLIIRASRELGSVVSTKWDSLFSEAQALEPPHGLPALALLDLLQPFYQWYQESQ